MRIIVGGISLTDGETGRRYQAAAIHNALRVNSALFPIAVSATAASRFCVIPRITDPRELIAAQRERSARQSSPSEIGRLSIRSVKRRAETRSRHNLLQQCLPAEELERGASPPPPSPQRAGRPVDAAVSSPDEPSGSRPIEEKPPGSDQEESDRLDPADHSDVRSHSK